MQYDLFLTKIGTFCNYLPFDLDCYEFSSALKVLQKAFKDILQAFGPKRRHQPICFYFLQASYSVSLWVAIQTSVHRL